jgi:hypothetical protein
MRIWYTLVIVTALNVIKLILAVTIIGLGDIALAAVASLLVQSAGATTPVITETVGEEQEASNTTSTKITINNNNNSNAVLGSLFLTKEVRLTSFNRINETYTELSYAGNRTIKPPDSTTTATINATEIGNLTFNLKPNGISVVEGPSLLETEGGSNNGSEQENATAILVDLNGIRPDDPRSSTGVAFFNTNSTGQLAFLDNMVAIYQVKASPVGTAIAYWEWKDADVPFGNEADGVATTIEN